MDTVIPANKTVNQFGDFVTAKNAYRYKVISVKCPKKRKVRMNVKVENSFENFMRMGKSWEECAKQVHKPSRHSNKRLYKQRKEKRKIEAM